jgi:dynein heavy chain
MLTCLGTAPEKSRWRGAKKWFESLDIEDLLVERKITFRPPNWNDQHWLQLEDFDNTEYDIRSPEYWLEQGYAQDGTFLPVEAKGLRFDEDGSGSWQDCVVSKVSQVQRDGGERPRFWVRWKDEEEDARDLTSIGRLQILFFGEDPELLADRIAFAFQALRQAQSRAKLNFFIDNMPIDDIQCLDVDQIARILDLAKNSAGLRDVSIEPMANDLVREANLDFARTMNKIILLHQQSSSTHDSSCSDDGGAKSEKGGSSLFNVGDVSVLEDEGENLFDKEVPWFALWPLEEYNFTEVFSNFCFASLYIKSEVVTATVEVASECLWLASQCLYSTGFKKVMRLDQFRQLQRTIVAQMAHRVKDTWVQALQKIILKNFEDVGKGWFSIHETNPDTYRQGKMKKLLAVVKFTMQDTLRTFMLDSVANFCHSVERYVPDSVTIKGLNDVEQVMVERPAHPPPSIRGGSLELRPPGMFVKTQLQSETEQFLLPGAPLFMLEIKATEEKDEFVYSSSPAAVVELVNEVLDMGLLGVSDVPQLDASIVPQLFKTIVHKQVLTTLDGNDSWVKSRRLQLTEIVKSSLAPLDDFLKLFDKYKELLVLDPAAFVQEKADAEIMTEECKNIIKEQTDLEQKVNDAIPDSVVVGLYDISCSEIRKVLAGKHREIANLMLELLLTRYRSATQNITDTYGQFFAVLRKIPKDIEGITEMRDYMVACLQKLPSCSPT